MRSLGESTYFMRFLEPKIKELMGETPYKLDYINGQRKVIIHTDRVDNEKLEAIKNAFIKLETNVIVKEQYYNHHIEVSFHDINKYIKSKNWADLKIVNPDYRKDLTTDGGWIYPLDSLTNTNAEASMGIFTFSNVKYLNTSIPLCIKPQNMCQGARFLESFKADCSHITNTTDMFWETPKLREVDATFNSLEDGYYMFGSSQLSKESALRILDSIPTYSSGTHRLKIFIHIDHKFDNEVTTAISNAESKGWKMTVGWNGTPTTTTTSTFSLRKSLIYARIGEKEHLLDWGHYVTNWEESGYQEFSSLEEAYEYFGLEIPKEEIEI